jgi:N-acyl-D-amino-acid deacylase
MRKRIIDEMLVEIKRYKFKNYSFAVVANYNADSTYNGKTISEINRAKGRKANAKWEAETILDMVEQGGAQMVYHTMNEDDVRIFLGIHTIWWVQMPVCLRQESNLIPAHMVPMPGYSVNT